jgi:hypothetical protein
MINDIFPIQIIHELFHKIHGAKYLFKMDVKLGYYQKNIRKEDIPKTALCSDEGLYEFQVMPFVLSNALANFQAVMNDLFHMYLWNLVPIFFDDILVCRKMELTPQANRYSIKLYLNKSECNFGQREIVFLGYLVLDEGIKVDPYKIVAGTECIIPNSITSL